MVDVLALRRLIEDMLDIESRGIVDLDSPHDRGYREGYRDSTAYWRQGIEEALEYEDEDDYRL